MDNLMLIQRGRVPIVWIFCLAILWLNFWCRCFVKLFLSQILITDLPWYRYNEEIEDTRITAKFTVIVSITKRKQDRCDVTEGMFCSIQENLKSIQKFCKFRYFTQELQSLHLLIHMISRHVLLAAPHSKSMTQTKTHIHK